MRFNLARLRNLLMALLVAVTGLVVLAGPASAHHPVITGTAVCNTATGKYDVTWTIKSDADYNKNWKLTSVSRSIGIAAPTAVQDDQYVFTGSESVAGTNAVQTLSLTVAARWQNKNDPNAGVATSTMTGNATIPATTCAKTTVLPEDYKICHATGADKWVFNYPANSGQLQGHIGQSHQDARDIIPPITVDGVTYSQNWDTRGQQIFNNGCALPTYTTVAATFTDQRCTQQQTYVGPSFNAPTYPGISRSISGAGANGTADPGETIVVTYTGTNAAIINNADANNTKTFTHAFPAEPNELKDCVPQPPAETREVPGSSHSCQPAGLTTWTDVYTTPYVWNQNQGMWVKGQETGPVRTNEVFNAYSDQQYFEKCAPAKPQPEKREVPGSDPSCDPAGVSTWTDVYTTPYVWNLQTRTWELGTETGPVRTDEGFTPYSDEEFFEECGSDQPPAEEREVPGSDPSCDPAGVSTWTDVYTTPYVWNLQTRTWELGTETGPVRTDEGFTPYTDEEFFEECATEQPPADRRVVEQSEPSCDPAGVTYWNDVYTTEYVWNLAERRWEAASETGPVREMVTFTPYTDEEYKAACGTDQPPAEKRREPASQPSCALGGVTSWTNVWTTEYVWNSEARTWELGTETGPVVEDEVFTPYTDAEYQEICADGQPPAEKRREPASQASCEQGGVTSWTNVWTTEYVWNSETRKWELGTETGPVRENESFTPYTDDQYRRLCGSQQPPAEQRRVPQSDSSCELGGVTSWVDVYSTPYVWNSETRKWVLGTETGPVRTGETFTPYTDDEYFALCAPAQPEDLTREVAGVQADCELGGQYVWTDVYTTPSVWNAETRTWELGEETGPVRVDEQFVELTDEELEELGCDVEVKGEQGEVIEHELPEVEVKGEEETAGVPTAVDAGLGGDEGAPYGRDPLWLLAIGGGLGLIGTAGLRRREAAKR